MLNDQQLNELNKYVLEQYPNEAVLIISEDDELIPLPNTHPNPTERFRVNSVDVLIKYKAKALIHSHIIDHSKPRVELLGVSTDYRIPSKADMQSQQQIGIPYGIVATDGGSVTPILWFPDDDGSLLGQTYISNVYDCYRVVRAYYWQHYGLEIGDHPREVRWWEEDPNMFITTFQEYGWYTIPLEELEKGDMVLMRLNKNFESHAAIYLGEDKILHHMVNELSREDRFSKYKPVISRALRYKDKP